MVKVLEPAPKQWPHRTGGRLPPLLAVASSVVVVAIAAAGGGQVAVVACGAVACALIVAAGLRDKHQLAVAPLLPALADDHRTVVVAAPKASELLRARRSQTDAA